MTRSLLVVLHVIQETLDVNVKVGKPTKFVDISFEIF
jgi:hypothetical protein